MVPVSSARNADQGQRTSPGRQVRIAVAGLAREGNTFAGGAGTLDDFRRHTWCQGDEILSVREQDDSLAGAIEVAEERDVDIVATFHAQSGSGPDVTAAAHAELKTRVLDGLASVVDQVDGIYLRLHGAMTADGCHDVEGDLMQAVRELAGPEMPISVSLDLHTHGTQLMVEATSLIAGYLTYPHVDMIDTGRRAMTMLLDQIDGRIHATAGFRKIPVMSASEVHNTTEGPVAEVMRIRDNLVEDGSILDGSIFCTQPWLDVPDLGWSVVVVTDADAEDAQHHADDLASALFDRRERLVVTKEPLAEALQTAVERRGAGGPLVLGDGADSPSAGSTGDSPEMLQAVLNTPLEGPAICSVVDKPAVAQCLAAGIGATVTVAVGGTLSPHFFSSVTVTGQVISASDGSRTSPAMPITSGRAVVLRIGRVLLVVSEFPNSMVNDWLYRRMGLDVTSAWMVQAKSAGQYRDGFREVAGHMIDVDMRGPSQHDLESLEFRRATHPWWPKARGVTKGW